MTTEEIHDYIRTSGRTEIRLFPSEVAEELSDLAAVLLNDLHRRQEKRKKPLKRDGLKWSYDAVRAFLVEHPYASEPGIRKALHALESAGYVTIEKTGKYNKKRYDKKLWYHVTVNGCRNARAGLIRFHPEVAATLDIPKAVLLQNFRHQLHATDGVEYVTLDPAELNIPYHPKTIGRHLVGLVEAGILEPDPETKHRYRLSLPAAPVQDWRAENLPIVVAPIDLLPPLNNGQIGLLVGHSNTGKTSLSTFIAVQNAVAGKKVLYLTLEEPIGSIANRMYAQEFGVNCAHLHQSNPDAMQVVNEGMANKSERIETISKNLKIVDLSGEPVQVHEVVDAIHAKIAEGFTPDLVIIDQLEFIEVEFEDSPAAIDPSPSVETLPKSVGKALLPALVIRDALGQQPFLTWILHQAGGSATLDFTVRDVAGAEPVTGKFDAVIGIGRDGNASDQLRLFTLTSQVQFDRVLDADFPHMRFKPKV